MMVAPAKHREAGRPTSSVPATDVVQSPAGERRNKMSKIKRECENLGELMEAAQQRAERIRNDEQEEDEREARLRRYMDLFVRVAAYRTPAQEFLDRSVVEIFEDLDDDDIHNEALVAYLQMVMQRHGLKLELG